MERSLCLCSMFCYQATLVWLARPKDSVAAKIQWSKTISECTETVFIHFWFSVKALFFFRCYQIMGLKRKRFLISCLFYVLERCCLSHRSSGPRDRYFSIRVNVCAKIPWKCFIFVQRRSAIRGLVRHFFELSEQEN